MQMVYSQKNPHYYILLKNNINTVAITRPGLIKISNFGGNIVQR